MSASKTKVLVTGGAGYIGSVLTPLLLQEGFAVTVIDNFMYKQNSLLDVCYSPNFDVICGDVQDQALLRSLVPRHDVIVPLAAIVGAPACEKTPELSAKINLYAIEELTNLVSTQQKMIFPVTNSGYGLGEGEIQCTESSPLRPVSQYGRDKVAAEGVLLEWGNAVCFRLATVFGISPRMRIDLLVNDFVYRAVNDRFIVLFEAHFKRNFVHVRDVANAFLFAIKNYDLMKGQTYNHGLDEANLSKHALCTEIKKHIPGFCIFESDIGKDPDQRNYIVSNEKLRRTGFQNRHSLNDGIEELIKGYRVLARDQYTNL